MRKKSLFYFSQKRYRDAEPLYKWALAIQKMLEPEHPDLNTVSPDETEEGGSKQTS